MVTLIGDLTLERVLAEYQRPKMVPTTLVQVAEMFGVDYIDLCLALRPHFHLLRMHVIPAQIAQHNKQNISDYLCDYYLVSCYSYEIVAIIFDYASAPAVRAALNKSEVYRRRVKFQKNKCRSPRPKIVDYQLSESKQVRATDFTITQLNRATMSFVNARLPIAHWQDTKPGRELSFYPPVWDAARAYATDRDVSLSDLFNTVILRLIICSGK